MRVPLRRRGSLPVALVGCVAMVVGGGCAGPGLGAPTSTPPAALAARVDAVLDAPPFDQVQWGVRVVELSNRRVLYERAAATRFIPGSSMKLPVSVTALDVLGPDSSFDTSVRSLGPLDRGTGVLDGDLVVWARGDPTLSARFRGDDGQALRDLAAGLREAGVRTVTGSLWVDASGWDSTSAVASWMVEDLGRATTGGAFVLAEGLTTVVVQSGSAPGDPARVTWTPYGEAGFVLSRVMTSPAGATPQTVGQRIRSAYHPESRRLVLDGSIPVGTTDTLVLGTRDPVRQSAAALARALVEAGIDVRGGWKVAWDVGEPLGHGCFSGDVEPCLAPVLARLPSPGLIEVIELILGPSHNWMAEQVARSLGGGAQRGVSGTLPVARAGWPDGLAAVRRHVVDVVGIDSLDLQMRDGSGLSAQNLITPRAVVRLLQYAASAPWGDAFRRALAEPGEVGGTLAARLAGLSGRVFAKTGSLTNVAAISGYVVRPDGTEVVFSILANGSGLPGSRVQGAMDEVIRVIAGG